MGDFGVQALITEWLTLPRGQSQNTFQMFYMLVFNYEAVLMFSMSSNALQKRQITVSFLRCWKTLTAVVLLQLGEQHKQTNLLIYNDLVSFVIMIKSLSLHYTKSIM